jgi:phosphotransferase system enzyme I (PtsI)
MLVTRAVLSGLVGSPGAGVGSLLVVRPTPIETSPPRPGGSPASERERLLVALERAAEELEALARQLAERAGEELGAIFEAQALFARDPGIVDPAINAIEGGAGAADAILASTDAQASTLAAVDDEYFRARAADVRDVGDGSPGSLATSDAPTSGTPTAVPRSSSRTTSIRRPWPLSGQNWSPGSRLPVARRPVTRRSSRAGWASRWCSGSGWTR